MLRPNSVLPGNSGMVFAALRNLQHLVIDLDRETWGNPNDSKSITAEVRFKDDVPNKNHNHKPFHLAYNLLNQGTNKKYIY